MSRTPQKRSQQIITTSDGIRRKYTPATHIRAKRRFKRGEENHLRDMCVILTIAGFNNTQISRVVNVSRGQVKEILESPEGTELYQLLIVKIPEAAKTLLESLAIEAVQAIANVMRTTQDDRYILQAAGEILDRTGLAKATKSEKKIHQTNEDLTTISDDGIVEKLREAPPHVQEEAAQMIEKFEELLKEFGEEVVDGDSD